MDAVFRPGIDTLFSPTTFDAFLMGDGSVENPIVLDEEEDKKNAPPPTTPKSSYPPNLLGYKEVELLGQEWKMYPIMFLEICFINYYCVCVLV